MTLQEPCCFRRLLCEDLCILCLSCLFISKVSKEKRQPWRVGSKFRLPIAVGPFHPKSLRENLKVEE